MDIGRRHKAPVEETKDNLLSQYQQHQSISICASFLILRLCLHTWRAMLLERIPEFREPKSFVMGSSGPVLCSRIPYMILDYYTRQEACLSFAPEGDTVSFKAICCMDSLENIAQSKG